MKMRIMMIVLLTAFAGLVTALPGWAQDPDELQSLVDNSAEEEEEPDNIPGANIPGLDNDIVSGKMRMPSGEEATAAAHQSGSRYQPGRVPRRSWGCATALHMG